MSLAHLDKLEKIARALVDDKPVSQFWDYESPVFSLEYRGVMVAKERARSGRGGTHHYTPEATRAFEKKIKQLAKDRMKELKLTRFYRGLVIYLEVTDDIPPDWPWWMKRLATNNMIFDMTGGDLDNREKAILDAFNRVVFDDDRQVVQVYKFRHFGDTTGFKIQVFQVGLTKNDLDNIEKFIGNRHAPQDTRAT